MFGYDFGSAGGDARRAHDSRHQPRSTAHPEPSRHFLGFIASMYVGNVVLLILNLPMVGLFVNLLRIPTPICTLHPRAVPAGRVFDQPEHGRRVDCDRLRRARLLPAQARLRYRAAGARRDPRADARAGDSPVARHVGRRLEYFAKRPIAGTMLALVAALVIYNLFSRGWRTRVGLEEK